MEFRYLNSTDSVSFQSYLIYESSGRISYRVSEERTTSESPRLFSGTEGSRIGCVIGYEVCFECRIQDAPMRSILEDRVTIREIELIYSYCPGFSCDRIEDSCFQDGILCLKSETPGISCDCTTDRTRESYPLPEKRIFPYLGYLEREWRYEFSGSSTYLPIVPLYSFEHIPYYDTFEYIECKDHIGSASEKYHGKSLLFTPFPDIMEFRDIRMFPKFEKISCNCRSMKRRILQ